MGTFGRYFPGSCRTSCSTCSSSFTRGRRPFLKGSRCQREQTYGQSPGNLEHIIWALVSQSEDWMLLYNGRMTVSGGATFNSLRMSVFSSLNLWYMPPSVSDTPLSACLHLDFPVVSLSSGGCVKHCFPFVHSHLLLLLSPCDVQKVLEFRVRNDWKGADP